MKRKKLQFAFLIMVMVLTLLYVPVQGEAKNVTNTYKKQVSKMLQGFDSYLGYCCGKNHYFKYDVYARTTMVYLKNLRSIYDKPVSYAKRKLASQMKLYFNNSKVKLKKYKNYKFPTNPSYLVQNKGGRIIYVGGDWGEVIPRGLVKRIEKNGSQYIVTYNIHWYDIFQNKYIVPYDQDSSLMGTYKIILKRSKNRNGFIIKNIQQTYTTKKLL